jgi:hypothetical protein
MSDIYDKPSDYWQGNYIHPTLNMRFQPIPAPFSARVDSQRVEAGSQFSGTIPKEDQGIWGDGSGPTAGGRWMYNEDVLISRIEFQSDGTEPSGRTGDSGIYVVRKGGAESLILDLSNTTTAALGTNEFAWLNDPFILKQGEVIKVRTTDATLEMQVNLSVELLRQKSFLR